MDTDLLRTFLAVARAGSFTAAARELGYVQSTVTGHVQALERRLGARLLDRLTSGAVLTDDGTRVLDYAVALLDLEARMCADVGSQPGRVAGTVRLLAPESLCAHRLPALLSDVRAATPDIRLTLGPAGTVSALAAVRAAAADAALLLEPVLSAPDLILEPLGIEELSLLTAPTGDLAGKAATWTDLAAHDALLLEEGCSYGDEAARHLIAAGQPDSRRTRFGAIEAVKRCVAAGLGWTILPTVTAAAELSSGTLSTVRGPDIQEPVVYLATNPARTLTAAARLILDRVRAIWTD